MRYRSFLLHVFLFCMISALQLRVTGALPAQVNGEKPVILAVFGLPNTEGGQYVMARAEAAVLRDFMKRYPNVRLKLYPYPKGRNIDEALTKAIAKGAGPDVLTTTFRQSDYYIQRGALLPLDALFEEWSNTAEGKAEVGQLFDLASIAAVARRKGPDGKEHLWAIPPEKLCMIMLYRKDLMKKAGLDPEKPPQTWDEFYDACVKVTDPQKGIYAYTLAGTWFLSWMLWSEGNKMLDTDDGLNWHAEYNSDEKDNNALQAFKFAWKLENGPWAICPDCDTHFTLPLEACDKARRADLTAKCPNCHRGFTVEELFNNKSFFQGFCIDDYTLWGKAQQFCMLGYMGDTILNIPGVDFSIVKLARVPESPLGRSVSEINAKMYAINGKLDPDRDRGKIEAAWAYIRFQCSDEVRQIKVKVFVDEGYAGYLNPKWLRKFGYAKHVNQELLEWEKIYNGALQDGIPEPYGRKAYDIYDEMDIAWNEVRKLPLPEDAKIKAILDRNVLRTNKMLKRPVTSIRKGDDKVALTTVAGAGALLLLLAGSFAVVASRKRRHHPPVAVLADHQEKA